MITKERLEQLIKQGATIYYHKLESGDYFDRLDLTHSWVSNNINDIEPDRLFETKEELEFDIEFGNITRTERLELPSWEEIKKEKHFSFLDYHWIYRAIEIKNNKIYFDFSIDGDYYEEDYEQWKPVEATKENYLEACRMAKKLFLGE